MGYTPRILVIGGGAVGTGVARDLAIRGLEVTLVERGTLAGGTSGSMHALLHSGARYAEDDPPLATACRRENAILKSIGGHLLDDTGGLFARLPADPEDAVETKLAACEAAEIPAEALSGEQARKREPTLSPEVERAIAVPDAVVDPFALCVANARSAREHGAEIVTGTEVGAIDTDGEAVDELRLHHQGSGQGPLDFPAPSWRTPDYVVNAAGPWADEVAALAGLSVPVRHSQGAMLVVDRTGLETVLNRCRPRTEGDIAVPFGPSAVLGTTDRPISDPGAVDRDVAAVDFLRDELGELVPEVAAARPFRAYWGVRALPPGTDDGDAEGGDAVERGRGATIVDHEVRDGLWGMTSVFGGKLTTHRATAERVADHVCAKFGIDRPCRTAEIALPEVPPAAGTAPTDGADPVLCHDRDVRRSAVRAVLDDEVAARGIDLRPVSRLTRAGMGTCQGGRCAHRLASQVADRGSYREVDRALRGIIEDRWAGRRFALRGEGLAGAMATYDFHVRGLNLDGRPRDGIEPIDWEGFDAGRTDGDETDGGPVDV